MPKTSDCNRELPKSYWHIYWAVALVAVISVILFLVPSYIALAQNHIFGDELKKGEFGDQYGVANSLFSALAFVLLIITMVMQKQELSLQRTDMKDTQKVMDLQREQMILQSRSMSTQQFEVMLFAMLERFDKLQSRERGGLHVVYNKLRRMLNIYNCMILGLESGDPEDLQVLEIKETLVESGIMEEDLESDPKEYDHKLKRDLAYLAFMSIDDDNKSGILPTYRAIYTLLNYINDRRNELRTNYANDPDFVKRFGNGAAGVRANVDIRFYAQLVHGSIANDELILYLLMNESSWNCGSNSLFRTFDFHKSYRTLGEFDSFVFSKNYNDVERCRAAEFTDPL